MANIKIPDLSEASNIVGSDLLVLEQNSGTKKVELDNLFTSGNGIDIEDGIITNKYPTLNNVDLNSITYNYYGYVTNVTNYPTGTSAYGTLMSTVGDNAQYGLQIYMPYNSDVLYYRRLANTSTWNSWVKFAVDKGYPKIYSGTGTIVDGSSLAISGSGTFTATFFETGIVRVDFGVKISAGASSSSFNFGINRNLLASLVPSMPQITPTNFQGAFTYYNSSGAVNYDLTGFGGTACNPTQAQFWGFGRTYNTSGNKGGWPASGITEGTYITGFVMGTFEV